MILPKPKRDRFAKTRGASYFLELYCSRCLNQLLAYQKDGSGALLRLYIDRITAPDELVNLLGQSVAHLPVLHCSSCREVIGIPMLYKPENRPAYRLVPGSFIKKKRT